MMTQKVIKVVRIVQTKIYIATLRIGMCVGIQRLVATAAYFPRACVRETFCLLMY